MFWTIWKAEKKTGKLSEAMYYINDFSPKYNLALAVLHVMRLDYHPHRDCFGNEIDPMQDVMEAIVEVPKPKGCDYFYLYEFPNGDIYNVHD